MAMKEDTAELLGLRLPSGEYYRFRSCPFGTSQEPAWCQRLTECIKRQLLKEGIKCVVYLDDILICATTKEDCDKGWHRLKELAGQLGFETKESKCIAPCQRLVFVTVGVIIDILTNSVHLDETRRQKYAQMARSGGRGTGGGHGGASAVGKFGREAELCGTVLRQRSGSDQETGNGAVRAGVGRVGWE